MLLALVCAVAIGEWLGWPFLAGPLQTYLSQTLHRRVLISKDGAFRVRFVGGLRLQAAQLEMAAPTWSAAPHLLLARDVTLELRYVDLWRSLRGQRLRIHRLQAAWLDAHLERRADGQASWVFASNPATRSNELPLIGSLAAGTGLLHYRDLPLAIDLEARLSREGGLPAPESTPRWRLLGSGQVRQLPLQIEMQATGDLTSSTPMKVTVKAGLGRARLHYNGTALDSTSGVALSGRFDLAGPSLAAVGALAGVTLPTTAAFQSRGGLVKQGDTWSVVIDDATVGASRLNGAFVYEAGRSLPMLAGRLGGNRLLLSDLGPVLGTTPAVTAAAAALPVKPTRGPGRVLPDRAFNLAALRAMDANVLIDIGTVDLGTSLLESLRPLRGHLQLAGGVLTLSDLDARTAQGQLKGHIALDGRGAIALWDAQLRWDGLRLERWIHQVRANAAPPFVAGRLSGQASVRGQGRSTAEILASLSGTARTGLHGGAVSHLAIEAAGLDLAQGLGVLVRGDTVLPVTCAVADLAAERGVFRTRVMVLDTPDSTIWIDGTLSLASETLDLRAVVSPKDVSPLALRTPLRVRGSLAHPQVSIEKAGLTRKLASSFLLGLLNPLAALIPLIDPGDSADAGRSAADCQRLMRATARIGN